MLTLEEIQGLPPDSKAVYDLMAQAALLGRNRDTFKDILDKALEKRKMGSHVIYYFPVDKENVIKEGPLLFIEVDRDGTIVNFGVDEWWN